MMTAQQVAGHTGARQESYETGARKVLRHLMKAKPDHELDDFLAAVEYHEDGDKMIRSIMLNWWSNNCGYLKRDPAFSKERYSATVAKRKEAAKKIEEAAKASAKKTIAAFIFLNSPMPNGKAMRYCTGKEVGEFGALYSKIAKAVKPNQRVGEVFRTDDEIMNLYRP